LNKNIRISDIAKKAGVSIGTVDRVLHNRGEVSERTREKILQIIEEVNYRPNLLASSLASKKTIRFASLNPWAPDKEAYWAKPQEGITRAIDQLKQYGVTLSQFFFKMDDTETFTLEAEKILELNPDGVLLAPWAKREALQFTTELEQRNIPYVFLDSTLEEASPIGFIIQNSFQSGYLAAKLLDFGSKENSHILVIHVTKELENAHHLLLREEGFMEYFKEHPKKYQHIFRIEISDGKKEISKKLEGLGLSKEQIDAVFVTSSQVHLAVDFFSHLKDAPKIIGYDLIPRNTDLLNQGKIDFLICQKPEAQGYLATNLLFDFIVRKEKIKKENYTSIDIITRENLEYYSSF
jgi:LacI family transcriptional regulator